MDVLHKLSTVTFTSEGQVVIPSQMRKELGIEMGTQATVEKTKDGILLKPITPGLIKAGRGILTKGKNSFQEEWAQHKAGERKLEDR